VHGHPRTARRWLARSLITIVALLVAGNLAIAGAFASARLAETPRDVPRLRGVTHLRAVDDQVWRGRAPTLEGYAALAESGIDTIVDLRAERDIEVPRQLLDRLGLRRVHLPIRDGQTPTPQEVDRFLDLVAESDGRVFVHCGAGVGRTGAMAAAYLVQVGESSAGSALQRNLAVGPPSLEQIVFAASLDRGDVDAPPAWISAVSRLFDAPRRIWSRLR